MPLEAARNSMRMRLILIPSGILLLGVVIAVVATLSDARGRIASEIDSGLKLGELLISYALDDVAASSDPDEALERLRDGLSRVRHIDVAYQRQLVGEGGAAEPKALAADKGENRGENKGANKAQSSAPDWFRHLFEPPPIERRFPVSFGAQQRGELIMSSKPADEATEIWRDLVFLTALLAAISIAVVALLLLTGRHTLKPLDGLAEGLARLERGQFDALAEIRISELRGVGDEFNRLARTLARAEAENRLLIDRLLSIQEAERKELARELHDEFGASLFGIRAAASCIVEAAGGVQDAVAQTEIIGRAEAISALADGIQKHNYRILDRIRPVILHQMGLPDALRHLVSSWGAQHREFACDVEIPGECAERRLVLNDEVSLTSYRIVQECLTNVARHSKAKVVRVALDLCAGAPDEAAAEPRKAAPSLRLSIEDDGIGLPHEFKFGFGFLGMSERVRKLGGCLKIGNGSPAGTVIEALIPLGAAAASA